MIVRDADFCATLAQRIELAFGDCREVSRPGLGVGWLAAVRRGFVAWTAYWFLRLAGTNGRY